MSQIDQSPVIVDQPEFKQPPTLEHSEYKSDKDDIKQQQHVHMKEQTELPVDSTSSTSMVGGVTAAISGAFHQVQEKTMELGEKAVNLFQSKDQSINEQPAHDSSSTDAASSATLKEKVVQAGENLKETFNDKSIALKDTLNDKATDLKDSIGSKAASWKQSIVDQGDAVTAAVKDKAQQTKESLAESFSTKAKDIKNSIQGRAEALKSKARKAKKSARGKFNQATNPIKQAYENHGVMAAASTSLSLGAAAAVNLKDQVMEKVQGTQQAPASSSTDAAPVETEHVPKRKFLHRKRGTRRFKHTNMKTKLIEKKPQESIADTLGDKASEIQEIIVESPVDESKQSEAGMLGGLKAKATNVAQSVSESVSTKVDAVKSTASDLAAGANVKLHQGIDGVQHAAAGLKSGAVALTNEAKNAIVELFSPSSNEEVKENAVDKLDNAKEDSTSSTTTGEKFNQAKQAAGEKFDQAKQAAGEKYEQIKEAAGQKYEQAKEIAGEKYGEAKEKFQELKADTKEKLVHAQEQVQEKIAEIKESASASSSSSSSTLTPRKTKNLPTTARKPTLDRRAELPSLGTPNSSPNDLVSINGVQGVDVTNSDSAAATLDPNAGIIDTAKFYGQQVKDYVVDKIDNLSMNADDDSQLKAESSKETILDKAKTQLDNMKEKVAEKVEENKPTTSEQ